MRKFCGLLALMAFVVLAGFEDRPRDPWVFRCVLDKQPRMVVIALHEHLWVAYDATNCSLYKAWDGDVKFQGAVYDDVHGPQPETRGEAYATNAKDERWSITQSRRELQPIWRGYRFEDEGVVLQYEVKLADGTIVKISERPEVVVDKNGTLHFNRNFETSSYPDSVAIRIVHGKGGQAQSTELPSGLHVSQNLSLTKAVEGASR